jgi:hypothetical protein
MTGEPEPGPAVTLLRVRLRGQPATAYYLAEASLARKAAEGARQAGDDAELLDPATFAAAAALVPMCQPGQLRLVGVERDDGGWVQPAVTARAARRN